MVVLVVPLVPEQVGKLNKARIAKHLELNPNGWSVAAERAEMVVVYGVAVTGMAAGGCDHCDTRFTGHWWVGVHVYWDLCHWKRLVA